MSELDRIIPPKIFNDELYHTILTLSAEAPLHHILEIGSSSGGGSTEAFVQGIMQNPSQPSLYCIEVSCTRFEALQARYAENQQVICLRASSVGLEQFPAEKELELFYRFIPTALNNYPLEMVLGWLRQDIDYIHQTDIPQNGIARIKQEHGITNFDMVLIDGSEFLGKAELDEIYGADIIILDDINGFKNYHNHQRLLADPAYELISQNLLLRNGFSVFRKKKQQELPIHFFTIVLNGEPFIRHHIDVFKQLPFECEWHWHVVEGVADLLHDTAWSLPNGGRITDELHKDGLSNDGTSDYLEQLARQHPDRITLYRKPTGRFWNGKLEMVNAPLPNLPEECLLWQIDADEFWNYSQIVRMHEMFRLDPDRTAAHFICNFYVGPGLAIATIDTYGNHTHFEWYRCWRYQTGDRWDSHEPPLLNRRLTENHKTVDVGKINPFNHLETAQQGLIFDHLAYVSIKQLRFKQIYYGYSDAVDGWLRLQRATQFPVLLRDFFPWVHDGAQVVQAPLLTTADPQTLCLGTDTISNTVQCLSDPAIDDTSDAISVDTVVQGDR